MLWHADIFEWRPVLARDVRVATIEVDIECGEAFCDTCGDCLYCYAEDCYSGEYCGRPRWILYVGHDDDEIVGLFGASG